MRFVPGLVSVTFRGLTTDQIIESCKNNSLENIEWGGDVHVPHGNTDVASAVGKTTKDAGLNVCEYGSYYEIGKSYPNDIKGVVDCARKLGTDTVRVWAYVKNYTDCTPEEYANAVIDAKRICDYAPEMTFCLECHNNTLTEDYHDALRYLKDVDRPNFKMFWQPNQFRTFEYNVEACKVLLPYVRAVHVFSWESKDRDVIFFPLDHHTDRWKKYIEILKEAPVDELPMMLEFMHDGKPESLPETAKILLEWIK